MYWIQRADANWQPVGPAIVQVSGVLVARIRLCIVCGADPANTYVVTDGKGRVIDRQQGPSPGQLPPFKDGKWHVMTVERQPDGHYRPVGTVFLGHRPDGSPIEAVAVSVNEARTIAGEIFRKYGGRQPIVIYIPEGVGVIRYGSEPKPRVPKPPKPPNPAVKPTPTTQPAKSAPKTVVPTNASTVTLEDALKSLESVTPTSAPSHATPNTPPKPTTPKKPVKDYTIRPHDRGTGGFGPAVARTADMKQAKEVCDRLAGRDPDNRTWYVVPFRGRKAIYTAKGSKP